jgi:aspartate ammonia-lyase
LLARTLPIFCDKCLAGITAQREQCAELAEKSLALRLCVRKTLGEEAAERVRSRAEKEGISVSEALVLEGLMTKDGAEKIPDAAELSGCVRRAAGCTEKCGGKA